MTPLTQEGIWPSNLRVTGDSTEGTFSNPTGEGAASLLLGLELAGVIICQFYSRLKKRMRDKRGLVFIRNENFRAFIVFGV